MREPGGDGLNLEAERAMAERQVVHLARLVDDLMDVARISRGKLQLHREVVDLHTVVRQAVETARPLIDDRRHRLSVALPEGPIPLEADPTRLEQVFWNLLNNAAKYTEPGGRIELTAERRGGEVTVRVRDTSSRSSSDSGTRASCASLDAASVSASLKISSASRRWLLRLGGNASSGTSWGGSRWRIRTSNG
jgi:nitrogen fixation/metabolism regulation signal transduction histidine kinase